MQIKKAVITSAARGQRALPLQTLVDRDGQTKSAIAACTIINGLESIALVGAGPPNYPGTYPVSVVVHWLGVPVTLSRPGSHTSSLQCYHGRLGRQPVHPGRRVLRGRVRRGKPRGLRRIRLLPRDGRL